MYNQQYSPKSKYSCIHHAIQKIQTINENYNYPFSNYFITKQVLRSIFKSIQILDKIDKSILFYMPKTIWGLYGFLESLPVLDMAGKVAYPAIKNIL